jgi:hypothetical protein
MAKKYKSRGQQYAELLVLYNIVHYEDSYWDFMRIYPWAAKHMTMKRYNQLRMLALLNPNPIDPHP